MYLAHVGRLVSVNFLLLACLVTALVGGDMVSLSEVDGGFEIQHKKRDVFIKGQKLSRFISSLLLRLKSPILEFSNNDIDPLCMRYPFGPTFPSCHGTWGARGTDVHI